jgi:hypothetical protein
MTPGSLSWHGQDFMALTISETKPIAIFDVVPKEAATGGTSMRKLFAALAVVTLVWSIGVSAGVAGPHGCYRSHGCHK